MYGNGFLCIDCHIPWRFCTYDFGQDLQFGGVYTLLMSVQIYMTVQEIDEVMRHGFQRFSVAPAYQSLVVHASTTALHEAASSDYRTYTR